MAKRKEKFDKSWAPLKKKCEEEGDSGIALDYCNALGYVDCSKWLAQVYKEHKDTFPQVIRFLAHEKRDIAGYRDDPIGYREKDSGYVKKEEL